jgi:hypothetical protein
LTPDQSRAVARLAQTLDGDTYAKLQNLLRTDAHLAEYPSAWQEYVDARVGNVLKYSESQARDDRGRWAASGYPTWDDLSEGQQQALTSYQTSGHRAMNGYLRTGTYMNDFYVGSVASDADLDRHIKDLDSVIDSAPLLESDLTLYRGVSGKLADNLLTLQPGDSFEDKGYSSTSYDKGIATQFSKGGATIVITESKGSKGLDVDRLFDEEAFEFEVVLARNTKFTVDRVEGREVFVSIKNG